MDKLEFLLAQRYARAYLNSFGLTAQDIENFEKIKQRLGSVKAAFLLLQRGGVSLKEQKKIVQDALVAPYHLPSSFGTLVSLLIKERRLMLLGKVIERVISLYRIQNNITPFSITSSYPLGKSELKKIEEFLARATNSVIMYTYRLDKDLIAGIRLQSDTFLYEHSIRKDLNKLSLLLVR